MVEYRLMEYETSMADQEAFPGFHPVEEERLPSGEAEERPTPPLETSSSPLTCERDSFHTSFPHFLWLNPYCPALYWDWSPSRWRDYL
jgi:hypothetical protein